MRAKLLLVLTLGLITGTGARALLAIVTAPQVPTVPRATTPPEPAFQRRDVKRPLTVRGCIRGTRLNFDHSAAVNADASNLGTPSFVLDGPKELIRQIKSMHDAHEDDIVGIVTIPASRDTMGGTQKLGSKTTVSAGTSQKSKDVLTPIDSKQPLHLEVRELRHVEDRCQIGL